jgi:general secretion pathway protein C
MMLTFSLPKPSSQTVLPWVTTSVWMLAAAGMAYWALQWPKAEPAATVPVPVASSPVSDLQGPMARALGQPASTAASPTPQTQSVYILMGVIASSSGQGSALIATDGQPPKAYRVGQTVQDGWTLVSLTARQARLKSSGSEIMLELPATAKP